MQRTAFLGLRTRLVLSLLATAALTLSVAAAALLSPLEHRLRREDLEQLRIAATSVRPILTRIPAGEARAGSPQMELAVRASAERVDAQIVVVSERGAVLGTSVAHPAAHAADALAALRADHVRTAVRGSGATAQATYATPAHAGGNRVGLAISSRLNEVDATVHVVRKAMLVSGLIGLAAALALGLALATRLASRIGALRDTALRVARLGPVVEMVPDRAADEIGDLSRAFATMQDRLREQEEARRTFVATASHELRTPLSSLRLLLDLAREELATDEPDVGELRHEVDRAATQAGRLSGLADQLLDLSRLDAGVPVDLRRLDLATVVGPVVREFAVRAAERGTEVRVNGAVAAPALADPAAVVQVLRIMLDNALRFSPPGEPVAVEVAELPDGCAVRVTDRGPGVPEDEREIVFERFRRGSETGGEGGFGLGLAIGRELARRMGGDLVLRDDDGERGASFELRLPAA